MNKIEFILLFVCCLAFHSCGTEKRPYPVYQEQIQLEYTSLGCDSLFYKPLCLEVFDSLLLVCDPTKESVFKLLNVNTLQVVCEGGRIGNGPNDLMSCTILDKIDVLI